MTILWLYLARRDSKGIRILTTFSGRSQAAVRVPDLSILQMPISWQTEIEQIIHDSRMLWEAWVESADTYDELRSKLQKRGYKEIPVNGTPEFVKTDQTSLPEVRTASLPSVKSMVRKKTS